MRRSRYQLAVTNRLKTALGQTPDVFISLGGIDGIGLCCSKKKAWSIASTLKETAPLSMSDGQFKNLAELEEEQGSIERWNDFVDHLECVILAHASAGVDVGSPKYKAGIVQAYESAGQRI
jgi:hypothetical protein